MLNAFFIHFERPGALAAATSPNSWRGGSVPTDFTTGTDQFTALRGLGVLGPGLERLSHRIEDIQPQRVLKAAHRLQPQLTSK